jgi:hypothetical protein
MTELIGFKNLGGEEDEWKMRPYNWILSR